jgi:hypothetical protein
LQSLDVIHFYSTRPLKDGDYDNEEKKDRAFRFLSKYKSFLLRAKTVELKEEWLQTIQAAAL